MSELRLTLSDAIPLRYCRKGLRAFCIRHGISYSDFVMHGIPVSEVEHIDDAMLHDLIEQAKKRVGK